MPREPTSTGDDFTRILDAQARRAGGPTAAAGASVAYVRDVWSAVPESREPAGDAPASGLAQRYEQDEPPPESAADTPVPPATLEAVAAELGLGPDLAPDDLHRRRRAFALANHPDRADPALRAVATQRMMAANMLIDRALQEKRNQAG